MSGRAVARKLRPADRIRPPCYVDRETGAALLDVSVPTWNAMVTNGDLPPPTFKVNGRSPRWKWEHVLTWERPKPLPLGLIERIDADAGLTIGTVYVIGFGEFIKIGFTAHALDRRMRALQTACPEKIEVHATFEGSVARERALHKRFAEYRMNGEWFRREGKIAAWIKTGCRL